MEQKEFLKNEWTAFIWVNVGCLILFVGLMVWRHCPLLHTLSTVCVFHEIFHLYCPGCGGTRAIYLLLQLDVLKSFLYHPIVLYIAIILVEYYIGAIVTLIRRNGKRYYYLRTWFCYLALGIVVLNFVVRNLLLVYGHYDYIGDLLPYWINR